MHFADQSLIGRRLVVENMPNRVEMGQAQTLHEIYHMLYAFDVEVVEYRETAGSRFLPLLNKHKMLGAGITCIFCPVAIKFTSPLQNLPCVYWAECPGTVEDLEGK
jgi:hypothetical protein